MKPSPLAGQDIYKIKFPGKPIKTYTRAQLHKDYPHLFERVSGLPYASKRAVKLGGAKIGVHKLHPRELSERARARVCGLGLAGEARRLFVEEGMTFKEQQHQAQLTNALHQRRVIEEYYQAHPEEREHKERRRLARRQRKNDDLKARGKPQLIDYKKLVSPNQIAKEVGCSPLEVRKFLRKKNVSKRGGRYAFKRKEADKVIRALNRYLEDS